MSDHDCDDFRDGDGTCCLCNAIAYNEQREAEARDAVRYRFIRKTPLWSVAIGQALDEAVDSAMNADK